MSGALRVLLVVTGLIAGSADALAQESPTPAPSATPRPLGVTFATTLHATFVDQQTSGSGQVAPEAAGFLAGSPLAPNTPYDLFLSAPLTPGPTGILAGTTVATARTPRLDIGVTAGFGFVDGSITNGAYWDESLLPTLNPHVGSRALPYAVVFPTAPGADRASDGRLSILGGSVATADGNLLVRGGFFDLAQTDRFVFAQPALTSVNPAIAYAPAESLASALAGNDVWQSLATQLPLSGVDIVGKRGIAALEVALAGLPSPAGSAARLTIASLVFDHGEGTRYSGEVLHATTSGLPITVGVPFGANPRFLTSPQGTLATSTLAGQRATIAGLRAAFHLMPAWSLDAVAEIGRAWYDADPVALPGSARPGGSYHVGFVKTVRRVTASLDAYRVEARYATMLLPYGATENQWGASFAWPGHWPVGFYQLVDNSVPGNNREGYRFRSFLDRGPFELHLEYTNVRQIEPQTTITAQATGFVDGYYPPQVPTQATFGRQQRTALWAAWHPRFGDLTLDLVDDHLARPALVASDRIAYDVPQAVLTYARHLSANVEAAAGIGRYAIDGVFVQPIDFSQRLFFAGALVRESPRAILLATVRRTAFAGVATPPTSSPLSNFTGSLLLLEQRYQF